MNNFFGFNQDDLKTIIAVLQKEDTVEQAIIFGSRAMGNYKNGSDVDIALKGSNLNHTTIANISYLLNEETMMPYKFDVLNYKTIINKNLTEHIDRVGNVFYSKNHLTSNH